MKPTLLKTLSLIAIFIIASIATCSAQEKEKSIKEIKSKDVVKTRNYNPHIQYTVPLSDDDPKAAPAKKAGDKKVETEYEVIIDNFTGYFVEVYIDGQYKGTISDWGTLSLIVTQPYKKIYCITSGGTKDWLITGDFKEDYIWKLMK